MFSTKFLSRSSISCNIRTNAPKFVFPSHHFHGIASQAAPMEPKFPSQETYLIVGAGFFGASTAYHLKQTLPSAQITLLDRTSSLNPSAAGHNLNKIIWADYQDIFYMRLALEAQEYWRSDPIYKAYYHESGMLYAKDKGMARANLDSLNAVGVKRHAEIWTPEETRNKFIGVFKHANWDSVSETYGEKLTVP
jgi:sarcosine oxidase / L-pipecolate oxidase